MEFHINLYGMKQLRFVLGFALSLSLLIGGSLVYPNTFAVNSNQVDLERGFISEDILAENSLNETTENTVTSEKVTPNKATPNKKGQNDANAKSSPKSLSKQSFSSTTPAAIEKSLTNTNYPPAPDFITNITPVGSYITNSGDIVWEKVDADGSHICGATFLLMATQANWNATSSQQGSMFTMVDNSGTDSDSRCGYFRLARNAAGEAQDYIYRLWEIQAPNGYSGNTLNSYSYSQEQVMGTNCATGMPEGAVRRTDNLIFYPNSSWQAGQTLNGWDFGKFTNCSLQASAKWAKTDEKGNFLGGSSWNLTDQTGKTTRIDDCVLAPCPQSTADSPKDSDPAPGKFLVKPLAAQNGNVSLKEITPPPGYRPDSDILQQSVTLPNNSLADFGTIVNYPFAKIAWNKVDANGNLLASATFVLTAGSGQATPSTPITITDCVSSPCSVDNSGEKAGGLFQDSDPTPGKFAIFVADQGRYILRESSPPTGYLPKDVNSNFLVDVSSDSGTFSFGDIVNYKKALVSWGKSNSLGEYLPGSVFTLSATSGSMSGTSYEVSDCVSTDSSGCPFGAGKDLDERVGVFQIEGLADGIWTLVEIKAPTNYQLDTTIYNFTVSSGVVSTSSLPQNQDLVNGYVGDVLNWHLPRLAWTKVDSDDASYVLANSQWSLTNAANTYSITDCVGSDQSACPQGTLGVDSDYRAGRFLVTLPTGGNWTLSETKAPVGYDLLTNSVNISMSACTSADDYCTTNYGNITNDAASPSIIWAKRDANNPAASPKDAVFNVSGGSVPSGAYVKDYYGQSGYTCRDHGGDALAICDLSPRAGVFMIADVGTGIFTISEKYAPAGYKIDDPAARCVTSNLTTTTRYNCATNIFADSKLPILNWHKQAAYIAVFAGGEYLLTLDDIAGSAWKITGDNGSDTSITDCIQSPCPIPINSTTGQPDPRFSDQDPRVGYFSVLVNELGNNSYLQETTIPTDHTIPDCSDLAPCNALFGSGLSYYYGGDPNNGHRIQIGALSSGQVVYLTSDSIANRIVTDEADAKPLLNIITDAYVGWGKISSQDPCITSGQNDESDCQFLGGSIWELTGPNGQKITVSDNDDTDLDPVDGYFAVSLPMVSSSQQWQIKELTPPPGYTNKHGSQVNSMTFTAESGKLNILNPEELWTTAFFNDPKPATVSWSKTDSSGNFLVSDASFVLIPKYGDTLSTASYTNGNDVNKGKLAPITDCTASPCEPPDASLAPNQTYDTDPTPGKFKVNLERTGDPNIFGWGLFEVLAPDGYVNSTFTLSNQTDFSAPEAEFNVSGGGMVSLGGIKNYRHPQLTWQKVFTSSGNSIALAGATFRLTIAGQTYDIKDCVSSNNTPSSITSPCPNYPQSFDLDPAPGKFAFQLRSLNPSSSSPVPFTVQEITPPPGFTLDPTVYTSTFNPTDKTEGTIDIADVFVDIPIPPTLSWEKVDDSGTHLADSIWQLQENGGAGIKINIVDNTGQGDYDPTSGHDQDPRPGYFLMTEIPIQNLGETWTLSEIQAPDGYKKIENITGTCSAGFNINLGDKIQCGSFVNSKFPIIVWAKVSNKDPYFDSAQGSLNTLNGSKWQLQKLDNSGKIVQTIDITDCVSYPCTATSPDQPYDRNSAEGMFVVSFSGAGDIWQLVEVKPPDGFTQHPSEIDINDGNPLESGHLYYPKSGLHNESGIVEDTPILGVGTWIKTDQYGYMLPGAAFELINVSLGKTRMITVSDNISGVDGARGCLTSVADPSIYQDFLSNPAPESMAMQANVCDEDGRAGYFKVSNLIIDGWKLVEVKPPAGYKIANNGEQLPSVCLTDLAGITNLNTCLSANKAAGSPGTIEVMQDGKIYSYGKIVNVKSPNPSPNPKPPSPVPVGPYTPNGNSDTPSASGSGLSNTGINLPILLLLLLTGAVFTSSFGVFYLISNKHNKN